jgi:hypothetical protein
VRTATIEQHRPSPHRPLIAWRPFVVCVALGLLLVAIPQLLVDHDATLSPLDEAAHVDYAIWLADGRPPSWDSHYRQETLRIVDCVGTAFTPAGNCTASERNPGDYPPGGYSYEAQQAPLGYAAAAVTWDLLGLADAPPSVQLSRLRLSNLAWILLFVLAFAAVVASVTRSGRAAAGVAAVAFASPMPASSWSYLTNDAAGPLAGSVALLVAIAFVSASRRADRRGWLPMVLLAIASGALLGLGKATFAIAPFAILVGWMLTRGSVRAAARSVVARLLMLQLLALVAIVAAYQLAQDLRSDTPSTVVLAALLSISTSPSFPWTTTAHSVANSVQAFADRAAPDPLAFLAGTLALMAIGASVGAGGTIRGLSIKAGHLIAGVGVSAVALGVAWPAMQYALGGYDFESQYRYLGPLIPVAAIATVPMFARRPRLSVGFAGVIASVVAGYALVAGQ